jgi:hypothetical protein
VNKTRPNDGDIDAFLASVESEERRTDCRAVMAWMQEITGEPPRLWGDSIIGFGSCHYVYDTGREGDWFLTGVSPRKQSLSIYIMPNLDAYEDRLAGLGPHRTGRSCLYIKRLANVDAGVLRDLITRAVADMRERSDAS